MCHLLIALLILSLYISHSETITCSQSNCNCENKNEDCNLQCLSCKDKTLTCNAGYSCDIDCRGNMSNSTDSCRNAVIHSNNATNLTVHCSESNDCKSAIINCNNVEFCNVICKSTNSISASSICEGLTLNCGTSNCNIICDNNTNTCLNININISLADSFQCIGSNMSCLYAPNPTIPPTTPSPILIVPHITESKNENTIIYVSEIIPMETMETIENIYSNINNNSGFIYWLTNNPLFILLASCIITFSICLCIISYCFIKQKYEVNKIINENENKSENENINKNIQTSKPANLTQIYNDKKRYKRRIETQSHISFSIPPNIYANNNYEISEILNDLSQKRISYSLNMSSILSPITKTNNNNNISLHLPLPITPIDEYKIQPVSPILSPINNINYKQIKQNNNNNIILQPPITPINEGMEKENITMAINEMFIINDNFDNNNNNNSSESNNEINDEDYDKIMTDDGSGGSDNPNIKDDEFIIKGDDDCQYIETKGSDSDNNNNDNDINDNECSIIIDDDMISIMSMSNVSEQGDLLLGKRKNNNKLNFQIDPINENLCNNNVIAL